MTSENSTSPLKLDAVIVGAGFSGIYILHRLRDELGLNVKILDAGAQVGGTWHQNRYPGARVDCPVPCYGFGIEEVWKTWNWTELYPGQKELQAYFEHVDRVLSIQKDCIFNTRVNAARFDPQSALWTVQTDDGKAIMAKYFIPAVGFAAQQYVPEWKGLDFFQGEIHHSACWPRDGVDVRGKRVAVIGTGASGIQIIQEWAKEAAELLVFQRTPNFALPMRQEKFDPSKQERLKEKTSEIFTHCWATGGGLPFDSLDKLYADATRSEWEAVLKDMYEQGGFRLWAGNCKDLLLNPEANRLTYDFWAKMTRERIHDPEKRDLLAPLEPPHAFGTKRPSLEQDYYEQFNKPHVHIVDTKTHPIVELTQKGIITEDGKHHEVDVIAIATGFNSSTGSLAQMNIQGLDGVMLGEKWKDGVSTFLGLTVPGYPSMFLPYGAQAPTPFTNGPVFIEFQANWIRDLIRKMEAEGIRSVDSRPDVARAWYEEVQAISNMTLFPQTKSWYMGANIPGKRVEQLYYFGGLPLYQQKCNDAIGPKFVESFTCH